jgi:hypothetical protein
MAMFRALRRWSGRALSLALAIASLTACGHPASQDECDEIVERVARLELEKRFPGNPKAVEDEIEETKESLKTSTMKDCVGKRITQSAMECVRKAKTSKEIIDDCFN